MSDSMKNKRLILILGGSGSGKSSYAEMRSMEFPVKEKYYLATMQVYGEEGRQKVERHKKLRAGKGFSTIEKPKDICEAVCAIESEDSLVLLECMSNLVANEMFLEDGTIVGADAVVDKIGDQLEKLMSKCSVLVIVSNTVFEDGILYEDSTRQYMEALGVINRRIAHVADEVIELVVGIPIPVKKVL